MNTNTRTCVLRTVAGIPQYVPASDVFIFEPTDRVFTGAFRDEKQKDGPSGSHLRTICLPLGALEAKPIEQCVLREVNGLVQYVPLSEVPQSLRIPGERVFVGFFTSDVVASGPSDSHRRTICTPQRYSETALVLN